MMKRMLFFQIQPDIQTLLVTDALSNSMNRTIGIASEEIMQELVAVMGNNNSAKINMMTT